MTSSSGNISRLLLVVLLSGSSLLARAQSGAAVRGEVRDARGPLPGAVVRWLLPGGADGPSTATDGAGQFTLPFPAQASHRVVVSGLGYKADTVAVPVGSMSPYLRVALTGDGTALGEVTVTGRQQAYSAKAVGSLQTISARDLTKSACCNLAESFETNAAVEVSTADAVSGAKQIQLLGLDGAYSLLTVDNQPALRGLSAPYRLGYLAGPWIGNIDIIKGTGSVVNGYEGISGQVNVQLKEPDKTDALLLNAYVNDLGKFDLNAVASQRITKKWSNELLLHNDHLGDRVDRNGDGFLDLPLATQFNAYDKVKYMSGTGLVAELGAGAIVENRLGGQVGFDKDAPNAYVANYGTSQTTHRYTAQSRTSYTWPGRPFQSLGLLANATSHDFTSAYSYRQDSGPRTYDGHQNTGQATLLFQSIIGDTRHTYRAGLSFLYDDYRERLSDHRVYSTDTQASIDARELRLRTERVPGAFAEYTYTNTRNLTAVLGLRTDYHNLYGWQVTPRFNLKYDLTPTNSLRLSAGRGLRVPNPIADNQAQLASARQYYIGPNLRPEIAWNVGGSYTRYFEVLGRPATFVADYYSTMFQNQLVADMYTAPQFIILDNLQSGARSFAHSVQAEVQAEPVRGLQVKAAYKFLNVQSTYDGQLLPKPLTPQHRAFLNLGYATAFDKWRADLTVQWFGQRPLAHLPADGLGGGHQHGTGTSTLEYAPRFATLTTQVTRAFKRFEVYVGVEDLTNFRQPNPIQNAAQPFSPGFDASMVWGPVYGRLTYAGVRYTIN
ncbi:TonB-dependent receptor [Hymenobacter sp. RP-2-7]|uniref:TonB-dependent receptor n=1 Tax=Hymenobacter polaris TaxID=2682546 RepID=A0A7Y0AFN0_9BACT|nr:TonB-dependent receptor [Hymenobacter polaris]NML66317.1 TonB-dependent receptor [Hymenobacter polaris]